MKNNLDTQLPAYPGSSSVHPETRVIHPRDPAPGFSALSTPIHHASTVLFPSVAAYEARSQTSEQGYSYGLAHTPTTLTLSKAVADWEGGGASVLVPSGLAAVSLAMLAFLSQGDHVLIPRNAYAPALSLCKGLLARMGVTYSVYDPLIGAQIASLIQENTRLIWVETPGSITMEVADLPAIVAAAHARGAKVAIDNTWSSGAYLRVFELGADISIQALTKYHGGHGDVLMGAVIAKDEELWKQIKSTAGELGLGVGADDAYLVLRGMQTMAVRLRHVEKNALLLAQRFSARDEVVRVLHPALPSCPGHDVFKRDFKGSAGVFSIVLDPRFDGHAVTRMMERLRWFRMGASWGGTASLALFYRHLHGSVPTMSGHPGGHLVRVNVGLEDIDDLWGDWEQALAALHQG